MDALAESLDTAVSGVCIEILVRRGAFDRMEKEEEEDEEEGGRIAKGGARERGIEEEDKDVDGKKEEEEDSDDSNCCLESFCLSSFVLHVLDVELKSDLRDP